MTLLQASREVFSNQLNGNSDERENALQTIKEWLFKQPHLPDIWDDQRLIFFLRNCNYSLEKTKRKLDMYFTMRTAAPEFFANRDIRRPELDELKQLMHIPPMPELTKDGYRVTIMRGKYKDVNSPKFEDAMKIVFMIADLRMGTEGPEVAGDVVILDAEMANSTHFSKISISLVKKLITCVERAYPIKLKQVHIINVHPIINVMVNWVKPWLKEKIQNRLHIHTDDYQTLYNFVPKTILPEEYGGTAGKVQELHDEWMKKLQEYTPWFRQQENYKADESKRPGKPTTCDDVFGTEGSFKKLCID